ncbi:hypothetical protein COEREDRAFT_8565 [Coemansia reversa NRRL 1564]|uniref:Uncharacterized protein n=1 Tax=Coemansia reversa (strain ATCC 12441 / NRRL 1564) TaxID=763665 RepID=A0A2G5BAY1_COERN|nr:hypothetical protein COEREDRAFT_8565 [Coemansia reversa NRRL 1564]|eukprot:PIA16160.1 hypothetical protein COEREDRAFT_8565 [Coemansia reversa NRRL 1564]
MTNSTPKKKASRRSGKFTQPLDVSGSDSQDNPSTLDVGSVREIAETQFMDADTDLDENREQTSTQDAEGEDEADPIYEQVQHLEESVWNLRNDIRDLKTGDRACTRQLNSMQKSVGSQGSVLSNLATVVEGLTTAIGAVHEKLNELTPSNKRTDHPMEFARRAPESNSGKLDPREFNLGKRDWVAHLEEEGHTARYNPIDAAGSQRPPTIPTMTQICLPTGLPTFGKNKETDIMDVINYAHEMQTHLYGANLDPDDFGCRAVATTVNPRLSAQLLQHATYRNGNPNWRTTVYWLLKLAPKAMSEMEAQTLLEEIRLTSYDSYADFVSSFEALRFRAGPFGKTHAMYIQQCVNNKQTHPADIWELEDVLIKAQSQQWLIADDEMLVRKQQQRMAKLRRQYRIPSKPATRDIHPHENNFHVKHQQQNLQNRSGLFPRRRDQRTRPAVKQIEVLENESTREEVEEEIQSASSAEVDGNSEGEADGAEDLDFYQVTIDDEPHEIAANMDVFTRASQVIVAPAVAAQLQNELGKVSGLSLTTIWVETRKRPKWTLPVTIGTASTSIQTDVEIDSGADCTLISRGLAAKLGAEIQPLIGKVCMADQSTVPREGEFACLLTMAKHVFALRAEVFPGKTDPPVLIGCNIIEQCGIGELLSALTSRDDHPLATTSAPDLPSNELGDDSANREQILQAIMPAVKKNATLDLTKPCPFPEAVVRILLKDEALVERHYQCNNQNGTKVSLPNNVNKETLNTMSPRILQGVDRVPANHLIRVTLPPIYTLVTLFFPEYVGNVVRGACLSCADFRNPSALCGHS